jgi:hypothetical protein
MALAYTDLDLLLYSVKVQIECTETTYAQAAFLYMIILNTGIILRIYAVR